LGKKWLVKKGRVTHMVNAALVGVSENKLRNQPIVVERDLFSTSQAVNEDVTASSRTLWGLDFDGSVHLKVLSRAH
jgi:hypothetical protein